MSKKLGEMGGAAGTELSSKRLTWSARQLFLLALEKRHRDP